MDIGNIIISVYEDISDICPLPPLDIDTVSLSVSDAGH